jgi:HAD superfamily hydrolase (TIGR01509 family)
VTPLRLVLLDAGKVLVRLEPWETRLARALGGLGLKAPPEVLARGARAAEAWLRSSHQDLLPTLEEEDRHALGMAQAVTEALRPLPLDPRYVRETCYYSALAQPYPEVVEVLTHLHDLGFRVGVVSNAPPSLRAVLTRLDLMPHLDVVVLSSDIGCMKPDPRIYHEAFRRAGVAPHEVAFADDLPQNVRGAREAGVRLAWRVEREGPCPDSLEPCLRDLRPLPSLLASLSPLLVPAPTASDMGPAH